MKPLSTLYIKAASKLHTLGIIPDSRGATLAAIQAELKYYAPERELLEDFLAYQPQRIVKGAYKMSPEMRLAAERAAKFQPEFISLGVRSYVDHL